MQGSKPWDNVVFMNEPPKFEQLPELAVRRFARALVRATEKWLEQQRAEKEAQKDNSSEEG